jgi:hypothetical protein
VLEAKTHQPPAMSEAVWVQAYEPGHSEPVDSAPVEEDGRYILLVEPGQYSLRVTRNGQPVQQEELKVADDAVFRDFLVPRHEKGGAELKATRPARHRRAKL